MPKYSILLLVILTGTLEWSYPYGVDICMYSEFKKDGDQMDEQV